MKTLRGLRAEATAASRSRWRRDDAPRGDARGAGRAPRRAAPPRPGGLDRRQRQRSRPGERARRDQAVGRPLRRPDRGVDGRARPRREGRRGGAQAVVRHGQPPLHLSPATRRQRRRPHPFPVRHGLRGGRPLHPGLPDRAGDEFGGEIPCAGFASSATSRSGRLVVEGIGRSPAILLKNHGVFTIGPSARGRGQGRGHGRGHRRDVWAALQIGTPDILADDVVERLHRRYTTVYGQ